MYFSRSLFVLRDLLSELVVDVRVQISEAKVFELHLDPADPEAVGDRRVDVEGLLRDAFCLMRAQVLERAHVVEAVRELDQDHADVLGHRDDHFAEVFRLLLFGSLESDLGKFRDAVDEFGDVGSEFLFDLRERRVRVFDGVVEEAGDDAGNIEPELSETLGDGRRMNHVRLAAGALLTLVRFFGELPALFHEIEFGLGIVAPDRVANRLESGLFWLSHEALLPLLISARSRRDRNHRSR